MTLAPAEQQPLIPLDEKVALQRQSLLFDELGIDGLVVGQVDPVGQIYNLVNLNEWAESRRAGLLARVLLRIGSLVGINNLRFEREYGEIRAATEDAKQQERALKAPAFEVAQGPPSLSQAVRAAIAPALVDVEMSRQILLGNGKITLGGRRIEIPLEDGLKDSFRQVVQGVDGDESRLKELYVDILSEVRRVKGDTDYVVSWSVLKLYIARLKGLTEEQREAILGSDNIPIYDFGPGRPGSAARGFNHTWLGGEVTPEYLESVYKYSKRFNKNAVSVIAGAVIVGTAIAVNFVPRIVGRVAQVLLPALGVAIVSGYSAMRGRASSILEYNKQHLAYLRLGHDEIRGGGFFSTFTNAGRRIRGSREYRDLYDSSSTRDLAFRLSSNDREGDRFPALIEVLARLHAEAKKDGIYLFSDTGLENETLNRLFLLTMVVMTEWRRLGREGHSEYDEGILKERTESRVGELLDAAERLDKVVAHETNVDAFRTGALAGIASILVIGLKHLISGVPILETKPSSSINPGDQSGIVAPTETHLVMANNLQDFTIPGDAYQIIKLPPGVSAIFDTSNNVVVFTESNKEVLRVPISRGGYIDFESNRELLDLYERHGVTVKLDSIEMLTLKGELEHETIAFNGRSIPIDVPKGTTVSSAGDMITFTDHSASASMALEADGHISWSDDVIKYYSDRGIEINFKDIPAVHKSFDVTNLASEDEFFRQTGAHVIDSSKAYDGWTINGGHGLWNYAIEARIEDSWGSVIEVIHNGVFRRLKEGEFLVISQGKGLTEFANTGGMLDGREYTPISALTHARPDGQQVIGQDEIIFQLAFTNGSGGNSLMLVDESTRISGVDVFDSGSEVRLREELANRAMRLGWTYVAGGGNPHDELVGTLNSIVNENYTPAPVTVDVVTEPASVEPIFTPVDYTLKISMPDFFVEVPEIAPNPALIDRFIRAISGIRFNGGFMGAVPAWTQENRGTDMNARTNTTNTGANANAAGTGGGNQPGSSGASSSTVATFATTILLFFSDVLRKKKRRIWGYDYSYAY